MMKSKLIGTGLVTHKPENKYSRLSPTDVKVLSPT